MEDNIQEIRFNSTYDIKNSIYRWFIIAKGSMCPSTFNKTNSIVERIFVNGNKVEILFDDGFKWSFDKPTDLIIITDENK